MTSTCWKPKSAGADAFLEDEDEQSVRRGDGEEIERDARGGDDDRAEGDREEDEREAEDEQEDVRSRIARPRRSSRRSPSSCRPTSDVRPRADERRRDDAVAKVAHGGDGTLSRRIALNRRLEARLRRRRRTTRIEPGAEARIVGEPPLEIAEPPATPRPGCGPPETTIRTGSVVAAGKSRWSATNALLRREAVRQRRDRVGADVDSERRVRLRRRARAVAATRLTHGWR